MSVPPSSPSKLPPLQNIIPYDYVCALRPDDTSSTRYGRNLLLCRKIQDVAPHVFFVRVENKQFRNGMRRSKVMASKARRAEMTFLASFEH